MSTSSTSENKLTTFINPFSYYVIRNSPNSIDIYKNFRIHCDGISLAAINKIFFSEKTQRTSFDDTSLAPSVFRSIAENHLKLGIIGCSSVVITKAAKIIEERYNININSIHHGYYETSETNAILENFKTCDIVIAAMGTPRQENFLLMLKKEGWNGIGYTCGGYFDQLSYVNGDKYYPYLINKFQLRWLYRIYKEPRRLWRRYLIQYPIGIVYYLYDRIMLRYPFHLDENKQH